MNFIHWGTVVPSASIKGGRCDLSEQTPIERLRAATRHLKAEMQNQRKCVTAFKQNIARLDKQMQLLDKSCRKFSDTLAKVRLPGGGVNVSD